MDQPLILLSLDQDAQAYIYRSGDFVKGHVEVYNVPSRDIANLTVTLRGCARRRASSSEFTNVSSTSSEIFSNKVVISSQRPIVVELNCLCYRFNLQFPTSTVGVARFGRYPLPPSFDAHNCLVIYEIDAELKTTATGTAGTYTAQQELKFEPQPYGSRPAPTTFVNYHFLPTQLRRAPSTFKQRFASLGSSERVASKGVEISFTMCAALVKHEPVHVQFSIRYTGRGTPPLPDVEVRNVTLQIEASTTFKRNMQHSLPVKMGRKGITCSSGQLCGPTNAYDLELLDLSFRISEAHEALLAPSFSCNGITRSYSVEAVATLACEDEELLVRGIMPEFEVLPSAHRTQLVSAEVTRLGEDVPRLPQNDIRPGAAAQLDETSFRQDQDVDEHLPSYQEAMASEESRAPPYSVD